MSRLVPAEDVLACAVECVSEVLGTESDVIDPDKPLSALGLESFTAVRLRRRIRERTDADLPLTTFLNDATTRDVAALIDSRARTEQEDAAGEAAGVAPAEAVAPAGDADEEGEPFALTPIQASYFVGRQEGLPLGGVATFYYYEYDRTAVDPVADLARLETAWNRLVAHHPMLRMTVDGRGRQRVRPAAGPYRIGVTDLRDRAADEADAELARIRHERSHQVRPTDSGPLFDIHAALLPDGRTRIHIGVDVLMTDLAGWMLLMRQWGLLVADPEAELPIPELEFPALQRQRGTDPEWAARRARDRAYWAERAPALPDAPRLPVLREPRDTTPPRFVRSAATVDAPTWSAVRARCAEHGVTPTATLLAAFAAVLGRWGAGERVCLNTTLFDRPETAGGAADAVGDFTTTALVGTPPFVPGSPEGFAGYAKQVNARFWEDLDHRSVSGVEVLRDLAADPGAAPAAEGPRYPVVFTSGVGLSGDQEPPAGWIGEEVHGISQTPQVLLDHIVWDEGGRLRLAWDWVDGAFPDGYVDALLDAHVRLLRALAHAEEWRNAALGWDPAFRPEEPLDAAPFPDAGPLLHSPARSAARRAPEHPALQAPSGSAVTHGRLAENAAATAGLLTAHRVAAGELVAVACEKGAAQITAVLGVSEAGAACLPIEPAWPDARVADVCARAGVRHALVGRGVGITWPPGVTVHRLTAAGRPAGAAAQGTAAQAATPAPDDLAYTIFTSGSTGSPKGVEIQHRAARTTIDDIVDRFRIGPEDRVLALSALSFDLSVFDVYGVLGAGGCLVLPEPARQRDPEHWLELMERHGVTVWNTAPALLEMLVEYAEMEPRAAAEALRTLRLVMLSGDWIPLTLPERLRKLAPQAEFMSLGGATEASIWSITYPVRALDPRWRSIPYGRALRGQSFHVLDENGAPCPVGETGELFIGGDGLARGYAGDPEQTAERFAVHPVLGRRLYRTGDLGRWTTEGQIEFLGRADRQVKIRGHRIELGEIEAVLGRHPGVRQCVAGSVPGPDGRPRLVAHLSTKDGTPAPAPQELAAALRERLPEYMIPSRFVFLDHLPVTANGKVDHAALPSPYGEARAAGPDASASAAPADLAARRGTVGSGPGTAPATVTALDSDTIASATVNAPDPRPTASAAVAAPGLGTATTAGTSTAVPYKAGGHWAAAAVERAAQLGLDVAVVVGPGALPADRALEAAAHWLRCTEEPPEGVRLEPRVGARGLAELAFVQGSLEADGAAAAAVGGAGAPDSVAVPESPVVPESPAVRESVLGPDSPVAPRTGVREPVPAPPADPAGARAVLDEVTAVLADLTGGPVRADNTFSELGATSFTLVLAHRRLWESVAPGLALAEMFAQPDILSLADRISRLRAEAPADAGPDHRAPAGSAPADRAPDGSRAPEARASDDTADDPGPRSRRASRVAARALAQEATR